VGGILHKEIEECVMKTKFEIVPAGRVYANQLAPHLRVQDQIEIWAASGMAPLEALLDSVDVSDEDMCWAALLNKLPVAMFGCNEIAENVGGIWMLCSPAIYTNRNDFMRNCKKYLAVMHERYEFLTNFVDARNIPSMSWLPRLGFIPVQSVDEFGYGKVPFVQYVSKRS
jgi:hypothetical protein